MVDGIEGKCLAGLNRRASLACTGGTISFIMKNVLIANELIALLGGPKLIAGAS